METTEVETQKKDAKPKVDEKTDVSIKVGKDAAKDNKVD